MPFAASETDSDVLGPIFEGSFLPDYQVRLQKMLPVWASVLRLTNSSRSSLTRAELLSLQQTLEEFLETGPTSSNSALADGPSKVTAAIQRTLLDCITHRANLVLNTPLLDSENPSIGLHAARTVLWSSQELLKCQAKLWEVMDLSAEPARSAWMHFDLTLSHCNTYYAADCITVLLRRSFMKGPASLPAPVQASLDAPVLIAAMQALLARKQQTLAISPSLIKELLILHPQVQTAIEQIHPQSGSGSGSGNKQGMFMIDFSNAADPEPVVRIMQQAIDSSIAKASAAVDKALAGGDPPPALGEDHGDNVYDALRRDIAQDAASGVQNADTVPLSGLGVNELDFTLVSVVDGLKTHDELAC